MVDYNTFIGKDGYVRVTTKVPGHNSMYYHRIVFEEFHKVTLLPNSHIHHIDGNKLNNDISNLELKIPSEHISEHKKGTKHPFYGKKRPEFAKKITGKNNPFYGKTHSDEVKQKLSKINTGENNPMYGKKLSEESRKKISEAATGENAWNWGTSKIDKHGGIPFLRLNKTLGKTVLDIARYLGYANDGAIYGYLKTRNLKWSDL